MEADGGFVEDVEDSAEFGADLGGEADALAFAAGEGGGAAVEGEVAEADGVEEFEPLDDLALEAVGDDTVAASEVHGAGAGEGALEREGGEIGDGERLGLLVVGCWLLIWAVEINGDGDGQGFWTEAATVADGTGGGGHVLHHVLAVTLGFGVFKVGTEVVEDAMEAGPACFVAWWAVEEEVLLLGGEVFEGLVDVDLVLFGGELDEAEEVGGTTAGSHGSLEERLRPVGDGLSGVEVVDAAEAVAVGAGTVAGVEGEAAGLEAGDVDATVGAGHGGGVEGLFLFAGFRTLQSYEDKTVGHLEGFEHGGFEAAGVVFGLLVIGCWVLVGVWWNRLEDDAVDYGFDGVVFALFEAHALGELGHFAVDTGAEALLVEGLEFFTELAFAAADDGGVDGDALAGGESCYAFDDLLGGLTGDGAAATGAVGLAY